MSKRQDQKAATRRRVLDAARDLFDEIGYEETTIRAVAERANVSVGSVFTTFTSKADVLSQVMLDRLDGLYSELDQVIPHLRGSTADRIRSFFAIHYAFETRRVKLFLAHVAASFSWTLEPQTVPYGRNERLKGIMRDTLQGGIDRGELRADCDIDLAIDTLMACYGWNYRRAATENADSTAMTAIMDRQIGVIFDGLTART